MAAAAAAAEVPVFGKGGWDEQIRCSTRFLESFIEAKKAVERGHAHQRH